MEHHRGLEVPKYSSIEVVYTFPLWNLMGQMVGYQQYKPYASKSAKGNPRADKYFTYIPGKSNTAWGVDRLDLSKKYIILVEGVFDANKLHNLGINALATLSNNPKPLKSWLWTLPCTIVPVCDGDKAGRKLASMANSDLIEYLPEGKDLGDLTQNEVNELFGKYK